MSEFTLALHEPERTGSPIDQDDDDVNKADKTYCCFVCSKPIELQSKLGGLNDRNLIQILYELLTGEKWCSTDDDDVLTTLEDSCSIGFCPECRLYLRLWNDLMTSISTILEKTNQIKFTMIANMLTPSRSPTQSVSATGESSLSLIQKLERIKQNIRDDYNPKLVLERLKIVPKSSSQVARAVRLEVVGSDFEETDHFDQNDQTDLFDQNEETTADFDPDFEVPDVTTAAETDSGSDEDENMVDTIVIEAKSPKSRSRHWKTIGPREFLYRDTYTVYQEDDGFVCAACSRKTSSKDNMRGHIKIVHLKYPKKQSVPRATSVVQSVDQADGSKQFLYHGKYPFKFIPSENSHSCGSCEGRFDTLNGALTHIRRSHYTEEDKKELTAVKLNDWEYLYRGKYKILRRDELYHCALCGKGLEALSRMYTHIMAKHVGKDDEQMLQESLEIPMETSSAVSDIQTENGISSSNEKAYMGIAYNFDPVQLRYKCSMCPSSVSSDSYIRAHIQNAHIDLEKKFVCDVCGESLKTRQTLRTHKFRWHGDGPTLVCKYCDKVFKNKSYFDRHVEIHEKGEEAKKFQCDYCGKKFGDRRDCAKHIRRKHTKEAIYNCTLCDKKFTDSGLLCYHRKVVHKILPKKKGNVVGS